MARAAGITMTDCRLFEENGRQHFMTRRFDRDEAGNKLQTDRSERWPTSITTNQAATATNRPGSRRAIQADGV
jgi:hypothetical protein